jgi:hypothetical protein
MKKLISCSILIFILSFGFLPQHGQAQQLGLSFSFLFPKNGSFSIPISPFSFRGLGINPSPYFSLETGFTLYRMSGMNVSDLPFESKDPLMGPFFSLFVPGQAVLKLPFKYFTFKLKAGGFAFYNFGNRVNYGNFDRAIRTYEEWDVANADLQFDNKLGFGLIGGAELIVYFTKQFGMNFEVNYLLGGAPLNLRGSYTGGTEATGLQTKDVTYEGARLDYSGLEVTMGVLFNTK